MDFGFSTEDEALKQLAQRVFATPRAGWRGELERAGLLEPGTLGAWELALVLEQAGRQAASTDVASWLLGAQRAPRAASCLGGALVPDGATNIVALQHDGVFEAEIEKGERQLCTDDTVRWKVGCRAARRVADAAPVLQKWTVALCALE